MITLPALSSKVSPYTAPRILRHGVSGLAIAALAFNLAACGTTSLSPREKGTAQGAAVGAVAGAVLGGVTGSSAGKGAVIGGAVGAVAGNLWSKHLEDKRAALAKASAGTGAEVTRTADNRLKVAIPADFSFDVGSSAIKPGMRPVLDELARNLDGKVRVDVVGHTDDTGTQSVNDALSLDRAASVRGYLSDRGVDSRRVTVEGLGERQPVASNATAAGRAENRRVEIFLAEPAGG